MQIAVIEYARNVLGLPDANSGEFDALCAQKVIDFMPGQCDTINKGGTLRLGAYPCKVKAGTTLAACYGKSEISERHRHRYEFNTKYRQQFEESGLTIAGTSPDGTLVETIEISDRAFYVGVQYHPEFKSRPNRPHPLFYNFIGAALNLSLIHIFGSTLTAMMGSVARLKIGWRVFVATRPLIAGAAGCGRCRSSRWRRRNSWQTVKVRRICWNRKFLRKWKLCWLV